jgi:hypothetical protein
VLSSATTYLWKSFRRSRTQFRDRPETVRLHPGTRVHLHPGILFGITPEHRSESSRNRVRLAPDSPLRQEPLQLGEARRILVETSDLRMRPKRGHTDAHRSARHAFAATDVPGSATGRPHSCFAIWVFRALRVPSSSLRANCRILAGANANIQRASNQDCQSSSRKSHDPQILPLIRSNIRDRTHLMVRARCIDCGAVAPARIRLSAPLPARRRSLTRYVAFKVRVAV